MPRKATTKKTARKTTRAATKKKTTTKKTATRRTAAKKTAAKRAVVAKKTAAVKKPKPIKKISEKLTKSQMMTIITEQTNLHKKDVTAVFEVLGTIIGASVKKGAAGQFTLPGLLKITTVRKPAKKARKGINPFTGEPTTFKAKPAHTVVKVRALKALKDMV